MPAPAVAATVVAPTFAAPPKRDVAAVVKNAAVRTMPTAHATNPCAVSRKKTSSVCTSTHLVRKRPARYPAIAEEHRCVKIIHTMPAITTVFAEAPSYDQGETAVR